MVPQGPGVSRYLSLPEQGHDFEWILAEMAKMDELSEHAHWDEGKVSGAVYRKSARCSSLSRYQAGLSPTCADGGQDLQKVIVAAFDRYCVSNPLHPDVFPAVRKMEAEVVSMVLNLFHAPPGAAGVTTAGGTESILMACLAARQKAYVERGITEPEM